MFPTAQPTRYRRRHDQAPTTHPGEPMTLGNMRANGVRSLDVSCWNCRHRAIISAEPRHKMAQPHLRAFLSRGALRKPG